jgi:hypothetical protein
MSDSVSTSLSLGLRIRKLVKTAQSFFFLRQSFLIIKLANAVLGTAGNLHLEFAEIEVTRDAEAASRRLSTINKVAVVSDYQILLRHCFHSLGFHRPKYLRSPAFATPRPTFSERPPRFPVD